MPQSDCLQILLHHDRWATAQLLDACGRLPADDFHRHFDIGPGSLHATLTHIIDAMRSLTQTLHGQEPGPHLEAQAQRRTPGELCALLEQVWPAFCQEAQRLPLDQMVLRRARSGQTFQLTRGAVLVHVATHGTHHRAQCLNMLRQLAVWPLPPSSVAEWTLLSEPQT